MVNKKFTKNYLLGVKAGAVSGLVYGVLVSLFMIIFQDFLKSLIISSSLARGQLITPMTQFIYIFAGIVPLITIIAGILFGLLFILLLNILPSNNMYIKASTLSLIFWLRKAILGIFYAPIQTMVNFLVYLLIGIIFSYFYIFFAKRMKK